MWGYRQREIRSSRMAHFVFPLFHMKGYSPVGYGKYKPA